MIEHDSVENRSSRPSPEQIRRRRAIAATLGMLALVPLAISRGPAVIDTLNGVDCIVDTNPAHDMVVSQGDSLSNLVHERIDPEGTLDSTALVEGYQKSTGVRTDLQPGQRIPDASCQ